MNTERSGRRVMDWLTPVVAGLGLLLIAADVWAQGAPAGGLSDALSGKWFDLVSSSPWMALCIYFIWDGRGEKAARLEAFKEGAEVQQSTADALRALSDRVGELAVEVRAGRRA